jgi:hypothetical protein
LQAPFDAFKRTAPFEEDPLPRSLNFISAGALALFFCLSAHSQDSPSLGDVARQAKKDKTDKPVAKVFTNDDMSTGSSGTSSAGGSGSSGKSQSGSVNNASTIQSSAEGLEKLQSALDQLASLDRISLAADVLEGNDTNFPGRAAWEEKLFAAKQTFVAQTRGVLQKAKQVTASAEGIKDVQDPNDARIKSLSAKLDQLVQETQRNSGSFQAVVAEGKALAAQ